MELGISWNANSSIEKSQNAIEVGGWWIDFLEYLFPRLFPSYGPLAVFNTLNGEHIPKHHNPFLPSKTADTSPRQSSRPRPRYSWVAHGVDTQLASSHLSVSWPSYPLPLSSNRVCVIQAYIHRLSVLRALPLDIQTARTNRQNRMHREWSLIVLYLDCQYKYLKVWGNACLQYFLDTNLFAAGEVI